MDRNRPLRARLTAMACIALVGVAAAVVGPAQAGAAGTSTAIFSDVPAGYWAAPYVADLATKKIVLGYPDGTFRPEAQVTRAQFVTMLVRSLGMRPSLSGTSFTDVSPGDWFGPYVAAAAEVGIVRGLSPKRFGPGLPLTREEEAVLLARALTLPQGTTVHFTDGREIGKWALPAVEGAVAAGYIATYMDGTFKPQASLTRAQAAQTLSLVVGQTVVKLAAGASQIVYATVYPAEVSLQRPSPDTAVLVNRGPGRWLSMDWRLVQGHWQPESISDRVAQMLMTYQIYVNPHGVVLSQTEERSLAQHLAALPYSAEDTPAGAISRLPVTLPPYKAQGLGQPKAVLQLGGGRTVLALTYPIKAKGATIYVPEGWYWWDGAPPVLTGATEPWWLPW